MATVQDTKISVGVVTTLFHDWQAQLEECFIKRDAFLEHVLRCEMEHFGLLLHGLESGSPQLFVSELTITGRRGAPAPAGRGGAAQQQGYLDVAFDLYGYLRRGAGGKK